MKDKILFISGGSGFLGNALVKYFYDKIKKIIIYSRGEYQQSLMQQNIKDDEDKIRYFIGDVRDKTRLKRALKDVNYIIHAAALKRIEVGEYNPNEMILTNIIGSMNIIDIAIDNGIEKAILISSDKACNPCTLYGYTKAIGERIFQQANIYSKNHSFKTGIVRYGNVANSKGSIIPLYKDLIQKKILKLPVTDKKMTRFWFDVKDACRLIDFALQYSLCGEIFIPKLKSFKIIDLVEAFEKEYNIIGLRNIEKIHEQMINKYEKTFDIGKYYCIPANLKKFLNSPFSEFNEMLNGFEYNSEQNNFMTIEEIKEKLVDLN